MVKLKGPGLAADASGSIGGALVFSGWKGRAYAKKLSTPKQPRVDRQISNRAIHRFLAQIWSTMSSVERLDWQNAPGADDLDPYRAFISYNLEQWQLHLAPSKSYPPNRALTNAGMAAAYADALVRSIRNRIQLTGPNDNWGLIYHVNTQSWTPTDFTRVWRVRHAVTTGWHAEIYTPTNPGTYYFRAQCFTTDGLLGGIGGERSATV